MDLLIILFVILLIIVALYLLTQSKIQIVPEEERLVVYRLGRFHRVAGPGPVVLQRSFDEIKRTFSVRDEPHNVRIMNLFMNGVPFGYTLNLWYRSDLKAAAADDRAHLVNLVQFNSEERERQVATKVREALVTSATKIEKTYKPAGNNFVHKLLPIIPGLPEFEALMAEVRQQLRTTLPLVGAVLNETQPITVTNIHLGNDIVKSFSRGRIAALLSETFPNLPPELLLQAVSSIEGIDMPQQRVVFEGVDQANTRVDVRLDEEQASTRIRVQPTPSTTAEQQAPETEPDESPATPVPATPIAPTQSTEHLGKDDLTILKRVPA